MSAAGHAPFRRLSYIALGAIVLGILVAIMACAAVAYVAFENELRPETLRKAQTVGRSIESLVAKTARWQVPLAKVPGVEDLFAQIQKDNPELAWIGIRSDGAVLFSRGKSSLARAAGSVVHMPLITAGAPATLEIAVDPAWVAGLFREMLLDMAVILVVALVISMELALYMAGSGVLRSLGVLAFSLRSAGAGQFDRVRTVEADGEAQRLLADLAQRVDALAERFAKLGAGLAAEAKERIRWPKQPVQHVARYNTANVLGSMRAPFFLFLFAEDLSRSFLPLFAGSLPTGAIEFPVHLVVSLPITIFMLVVAFSQPVLGSWSERIGRRNAFLFGAALGCVAHFMCAAATTFGELLALRAAAGLAWAVTFVAAQGFVIDHTDRHSRTRGLAVFVGIIMTASICGPSIGGILADGLGPRWTFAIGGALALAATVLAWHDLPRERDTEAAARAPRIGDYAAALSNPRFALLLVFAAIPAKVILIAYLFYLLPLYIAEAGHNAAMAGRIIMLYSVMMVLLMPVTTALLERIQGMRGARPHAAFVAGGLALSGLGGMFMLLPFGIASAVALVILLGVAQAFSIAPQASMVADVSGVHARRVGESTIYGLYRLVERLGNAAGPVLAAFLLQAAGFETAFAAIGAAVLACAIVFYVAFRETLKRKAGA